MKKQKEKVESFYLNHMDFMVNLNTSLEELDHDISDAKKRDSSCKGEKCKVIEQKIDNLANTIYSISEPRWSCAGHSKKIGRLRTRLHDLYTKYRGINTTATH
jgi:hypothetical protein